MPSNKSSLRLIRRISQVVFFLLFCLTILQATYPFRPWLPPELFLWLDPLSAFLPAVAGRHWEPLLWLGFIVLLSQFIFGRAFCGWICPLGTLIDASDRIFHQRYKAINLRWKRLKYALLVFFLVLALLGFQYSWLADPLPLAWRSFGIIILSLGFIIVDVILSSLVTLGFMPDLLTGFQDRLSATLFPLASPTYANLMLPLLIFLMIVFMSLITRRFWCRHLCPLGAALGFLAQFSLLKRIVATGECTSCGHCQQHCKMDAIGDDFYSTTKSECILCMSCAEYCSPGATTFSWRKPQRTPGEVDLTRRQVIAASAAGLIGAGLFKLNPQDPRATDRLIRPPGATLEDDFLSRCIRCGECIRICATTGGCLQSTFLEAGLIGLLTPAAKFRYGYCEYSCNLCGEICPTKAIAPLALSEKQQRKIGTAFFLKDRCIPYREHENCIVCEEHCPVPQKAIKTTPQPYTDPLTGATRIVLYPEVDEELCIGCGICENKCPLSGEAGIVVVREGEQRW